MNRSTKYGLVAIIGWIALLSVILVMLAQSDSYAAHRPQLLFGYALASAFAALPGIAVIALVWLKYDDMRNEILGALRHPHVFAHYLIAYGTLFVLAIGLYTYFATQYSQAPSNFVMVGPFIFLLLPLTSTAIYYLLRTREKDTAKAGKFAGAAFVALYAFVAVYAMMTSEQYSMSRNIFFESEARVLEVMLFIIGLLFNWFAGKMLGRAIFRASGKTTMNVV